LFIDVKIAGKKAVVIGRSDIVVSNINFITKNINDYLIYEEAQDFNLTLLEKMNISLKYLN